LSASELYVVKTGEFEVLQRRKGVNIRVNMKRRGDTFGEVALMFNCPRSATVAATQNSTVWVLEREVFRQYVREVQESESAQLELFLNSGAWDGMERYCCIVAQHLLAVLSCCLSRLQPCWQARTTSSRHLCSAHPFALVAG
jgi:hypothetical protein